MCSFANFNAIPSRDRSQSPRGCSTFGGAVSDNILQVLGNGAVGGRMFRCWVVNNIGKVMRNAVIPRTVGNADHILEVLWNRYGGFGVLHVAVDGTWTRTRSCSTKALAAVQVLWQFTPKDFFDHA